VENILIFNAVYITVRGSVLAFSTQVRGFKPGLSRWIIRAKKSSACLPSEGKYSRRSHVVDLRHVKDL